MKLLKHLALKYGAFPVKTNNIFENNFFFRAASSYVCRQEILFCTTSALFFNIKYIFEQHQLAFADTRLLFLQHQAFFSTQNCFSCNTKFLFCTLFRQNNYFRQKLPQGFFILILEMGKQNFKLGNERKYFDL